MGLVRALLAPLCLMLVAGTLATQAHSRKLLQAAAGPAIQPGSVVDKVCNNQDFASTNFCQCLRTAVQDPTLAGLATPTWKGTVFVPDDDAWNKDQKKLVDNMDAQSIQQILTTPEMAARVVGYTIIVDKALQYDALRNDDDYKDARGHNMEIDTGLFGGKYIKTDENDVRISGSRKDILVPGGPAYIHMIHDVILPRDKLWGR